MSDLPAPCQFCGMKGSGVYVTSNAHDAPFVECNDCGACGPVEGTEAEAITSWNKAAELSTMLDRMRSECKVRLGDPNDRFDKYGLTVIGPPDVLRQFAERLKQD